MKRRPVGTATAVGLVGSIVLGVIAVRAADWPTFGRDATRNAVSPEKGPPLHWQVEHRENGFLVQPAWNVLWEAQLGSDNFSPPVIANGLVWIGTNNEWPRDPRLKNDAAVLMCFRESDGKFLWQYVSPRLDSFYQDFPQTSINCSPLVEGNRLWFTTNRAEVVCLDVGPLREGKGEPRPVWKLDMCKDLGVSPVGAGMNIGFTCSIGASYKGRICVTTGNGVGEDFQTVAAPKAPSLLCIDKDTGKVLWTDSSPGKNILRSQWSSPLLVELNERAQVIAAQGDGWVRSFDVLTGQLIWRFDTNPKAAIAAMYACTGASPSAFAICGLPPERSFTGLASLAPGLAFFAGGPFWATAAFTSALNAPASTVSPSWMSIARRVLPSKLELKRRDGSGILAPGRT
jgi:outer membrane protein assembly factor BamB